MKKGDLVRNKHTGNTGTIISEPFTKLFRDSNDWNAMREGGGDYATAATAIRVCWHGDGYERTYKYSDFTRNHEIVDNSNCTVR
jgi:hypothetical protein